jgi:hypothetical protein
MIYRTAYAENQIRVLYRHYLEKGHYEAHVNLSKAIRAARARIEADPTRGRPYPSTYVQMSQWGFLWLEEGSYWFGWSNGRGFPVLTNVFYFASNMPRRTRSDRGDFDPL